MKVITGITKGNMTPKEKLRLVLNEKIKKDYNFFFRERERLIEKFKDEIKVKRLSRSQQLIALNEYFKKFPVLDGNGKAQSWNTPGRITEEGTIIPIIYSPEWMLERIVFQVNTSSSPMDRNTLSIFARHSAHKFLYQEVDKKKSAKEFFIEMRSIYPEYNTTLIAKEYASLYGKDWKSVRAQMARYNDYTRKV